MKRVNIFSAFLFAAILGSLGSCQTVPESISTDLAPNEYFQEGQEAFGKGHNETALLYYRTFVERYPDMTQTVVEAEYEIAFIIYKSGELEKAGNLFSAILDKYNAPGAEVLPAWPRVLSAKLLETIEEELTAAPIEAE